MLTCPTVEEINIGRGAMMTRPTPITLLQALKNETPPEDDTEMVVWFDSEERKNKPSPDTVTVHEEHCALTDSKEQVIGPVTDLHQLVPGGAKLCTWCYAENWPLSWRAASHMGIGRVKQKGDPAAAKIQLAIELEARRWAGADEWFQWLYNDSIENTRQTIREQLGWTGPYTYSFGFPLLQNNSWLLGLGEHIAAHGGGGRRTTGSVIIAGVIPTRLLEARDRANEHWWEDAWGGQITYLTSLDINMCVGADINRNEDDHRGLFKLTWDLYCEKTGNDNDFDQWYEQWCKNPKKSDDGALRQWQTIQATEAHKTAAMALG